MFGPKRLLIGACSLVAVATVGWFQWTNLREAAAVERVRLIEASLLAKGSLELLGGRILALGSEPILSDVLLQAREERSELGAKLQAVELGLMQTDVPLTELQSRIGLVNDRVRLWNRILDEGVRDLLMLQARSAHGIASLRAPKEVVDRLAGRLADLLVDAVRMVRIGNFDAAADAGRALMAIADPEAIEVWSGLEGKAQDLSDRLRGFDCVGPNEEAKLMGRLESVVRKGRDAFLSGDATQQRDWDREFEGLYRIVQLGMLGCGLEVDAMITKPPLADLLPRSVIGRGLTMMSEFRSALADCDEKRAGSSTEAMKSFLDELRGWHSELAAVLGDESVCVELRKVMGVDLSSVEQVAFRSRLRDGVETIEALRLCVQELRKVLVRGWLEWASDQPVGCDGKIMESADCLLREWRGESLLASVEDVRAAAVARGAQIKAIEDALAELQRMRPWVAKSMEAAYAEAIAQGRQARDRAKDPSCSRSEIPQLLAKVSGLGSSIRLMDAGEWSGRCERMTKLLAEDGFSVPAGSDCGALTLGLPRRIVHKVTGIELVLVPAGEATVGSPPDEHGRDSDEIQRPVVINEPFYIGRCEVSRQEWALGGGRMESRVVEDPNMPMSGVSGEDVLAFLKSAGGRLRLPSEEEWEYACRAGSRTSYSFGANASKEQINFQQESDKRGPTLVPCGSLPSNDWGLHEMQGNVWELCSATTNAQVAAAEIRPVASRTGGVVGRGGSLQDDARNVRAASRMPLSLAYRGSPVGVRVAYSPPAD